MWKSFFLVLQNLLKLNLPVFMILFKCVYPSITAFTCSSVLLSVFSLATGPFYMHFYIHWAGQASYLPLRLDPPAGQLPWHADSTLGSLTPMVKQCFASKLSDIEIERSSFSIQSPRLQRQMLSQMQGRGNATYLYFPISTSKWQKPAILGRKGGVKNRRGLDVGPPTKFSPGMVELWSSPLTFTEWANRI